MVKLQSRLENLLFRVLLSHFIVLVFLLYVHRNAPSVVIITQTSVWEGMTPSGSTPALQAPQMLGPFGIKNLY